VLRIGFAGAGFIAGIHAEGFADRDDARIAAVYDTDAGRAEAFAAAHGGRAVGSFEALLGQSDAVYVCSPNVRHAEQTVAALGAGLHVFCEKPLATSMADAERVRAAAASAKGVYQIGFNKRFAATYVELKRRIDNGALEPRWASLKMNRGELQHPHWVGDAAVTGGFLYETPIHILDLACWLFGAPRGVFCRATEALDSFAAVLTFARGLSASFVSSAQTTWLYPYERVEVYGEHAIAVTEEMDRVTLQLGLDAEKETFDATAMAQAERWGYRAEDEAFLAAIRGEAQAGPGIEEGVRAVEVIEAMYRSAASGEAVAIA
jgi:myo-inositol 2-dehydrogenase/D-chiro-inositol 1-dehydrogenase